MNYRKDIHGDELSILGYGCMRFSRKGTGVDIEKTEREPAEENEAETAEGEETEPSPEEE